MGVWTAKKGVITTKMGVMGHQKSGDFWWRQNCSPPRAPITLAKPLRWSWRGITAVIIFIRTRAAASTTGVVTGVVNYSSNFLLLEYSLISISGCSFFAVQTAVNWWIVAIYGNLGLWDFICNLPACALIKYEVKKSRLFKALTLQALQVCWPITTPYSSLAACIKVLPVLTSTRVLVQILRLVLE